MAKLARLWPSLILTAIFASGAGYFLTQIVQDNLAHRRIGTASPQVWIAGIWWAVTAFLWILAFRGVWLSQAENDR